MAQAQFGMIGLGVMGQSFALNVERHGYRVAVYSVAPEETAAYMRTRAAGKNIVAPESLEAFVAALARPRKVMLLIPAGAPVDDMIAQLQPLLDRDDVLIDGGNSFFEDSERRSKSLEAAGIAFLGMGVSGGEEGALWGPSLMPGGAEAGFREAEPILRAVAARAEEDGEPCVAYIGPGGAGHYVKMVHNGIEYGDMQLIAEAYDLLHRALDLSAADFSRIFHEWNQGDLASFLIEISAKVFQKIDSETGRPLVELILDRAGQKGTGRWTSQNALELGAAVPTITAAVDSRILSSMKQEREQAAAILSGPAKKYSGSAEKLVDAVRDALYAAKICSYAQGMALLTRASADYGYQLNLYDIARIWRAGCIIRARLLNDIARAYGENPELPNLLLDDTFRKAVAQRQEAWRYALKTAIALGVPVPGMGASLAYYDAYRSARLPANLIQAQRDFFGAHTFQRIDREGTFHADWHELA